MGIRTATRRETGCPRELLEVMTEFTDLVVTADPKNADRKRHDLHGNGMLQPYPSPSTTNETSLRSLYHQDHDR
jgi:hypothetical protein